MLLLVIYLLIFKKISEKYKIEILNSKIENNLHPHIKYDLIVYNKKQTLIPFLNHCNDDNDIEEEFKYFKTESIVFVKI
jgi:hypothetical protein